MGGMQVSAINTQNPSQEISYDMAGHLVQNNNYDYTQSSSKQVNYMGSSSRNPNNKPYSQTYNQGWRNHPNFGWRDQSQRPQNFNNNSQGGFQQNSYNNRQSQPQQANSKSKEDSNWEMMRNFMQKTKASIRNLEVQMGQLSKQIPERSASTFSSDTVVNPREDCKVIQLRSGKTAGYETRANEELVEKKAPEEKKEEVEHAPPPKACRQPIP
ncbi:uncharacterized protein LOC130975105 [Arachis stenosperma]|uniref:uncharacterized protein LOC130975105 n=1 Tax=Arachis stenosperma TaxID=217475 RepID=UPI0025ACF7CD|nr:uncharacterized protein LOC130975105 [Arachis stenosperma]